MVALVVVDNTQVYNAPCAGVFDWRKEYILHNLQGMEAVEREQCNSQ